MQYLESETSQSLPGEAGEIDGQPRIGIFVPTLLGGGAETTMSTLANGFVDRGVAVDLVVGQAIGPNLKRLDSRVRLIDLQTTHMVQAILPLAFYLRRSRPDALLTAMTHANNAAIIARFLAQSQTRIVASERTTIDWKPTRMVEAIHLRLRSILYRNIDTLVLVAREEEAEATRRFRLAGGRVCCIYNPIITPEFSSSRQMPPTHPWLRNRSANSGPVIVAVGRLDPIKDYGCLLDAFSRLRRKQPARLIIFGEGEQRKMLEARIDELRIGEAVSLPGYVEDPVREMNAGDLFVLSSRSEGLPGVLIQALGCGLRIVSTDCTTGPREILEGGKWGRLVDVGDVNAFAKAMEDAIAGPEPFKPDRSHLAQFSLPYAVDAYLARLLPDQPVQKRK